MTYCNHTVCGCQLWEYSNDLDWKEFCVGSLDFMKGRVFVVVVVVVVLKFILQSLLFKDVNCHGAYSFGIKCWFLIRKCLLHSGRALIAWKHGILIVIRLYICVLIAYLALDNWVPKGAPCNSYFDF